MLKIRPNHENLEQVLSCEEMVWNDILPASSLYLLCLPHIALPLEKWDIIEVHPHTAGPLLYNFPIADSGVFSQKVTAHFIFSAFSPTEKKLNQTVVLTVEFDNWVYLLIMISSINETARFNQICWIFCNNVRKF